MNFIIYTLLVMVDWYYSIGQTTRLLLGKLLFGGAMRQIVFCELFAKT